MVRDRSGQTADFRLEKLDAFHVIVALRPLIDPDAILSSDGANVYKTFAREAGIAHRPINVQQGNRVAASEVAQRFGLRQREALPRLLSLHDWLNVERIRTANGSGLVRAIDYALKRWPAILRYVSRGDIPIDNNPVENSIRSITLARHNWLFTGSERAGFRGGRQVEWP